jgi:hypothetical protein
MRKMSPILPFSWARWSGSTSCRTGSREIVERSNEKDEIAADMINLSIKNESGMIP